MKDMKESIQKLISALQKEVKFWEEYDVDAFFEHCQKQGLKKFSWSQYTPYFNDGEECTFTVNEDIFDILIEGEDQEHGDVYDLYEYIERKRVFKSPEYETVYEFDLMGSLNMSESQMEALFGDHVKVTVYVDERRIDVDDYDHD